MSLYSAAPNTTVAARIAEQTSQCKMVFLTESGSFTQELAHIQSLVFWMNWTRLDPWSDFEWFSANSMFFQSLLIREFLFSDNWLWMPESELRATAQKQGLQIDGFAKSQILDALVKHYWCYFSIVFHPSKIFYFSVVSGNVSTTFTLPEISECNLTQNLFRSVPSFYSVTTGTGTCN